MKTLSLLLLLLASMGLVLMGCSEKSFPLGSPTEQAFSAPSSHVSLGKGGAVVSSATGNGHVAEVYSFVSKWSFSFTARRYADETSSGEVQFQSHMGLKFHGTVVDLKVVNNRAKLCWTYLSGPWAGQFGCAVVEDNGEGKKATGPDMMTGFLFTDGIDIIQFGEPTIAGITSWTPNEFIAWLEAYFTPPGTALMPCDQGNVQVR
jgi:hypothetical protein